MMMVVATKIVIVVPNRWLSRNDLQAPSVGLQSLVT